MKILFVTHGLGPGGAERVLSQIANYFSEMNYEVSIIIFNEFEKEKSFYPLNSAIKIIKINNYKKNIVLYSKIRSLINIVFSLKEVFQKEEPDIIISFITLTNIFSTIAATMARKKIILSEHTNYKRNSKDILGFFRYIIYPFANAVVVLTNHDRAEYSFVKNVYTIHNPLLLENKYLNIKREKIILGVGRLIHLKGFDLLIKAFYKLKTKDWKLVIVGEGPERNKLESLINNLGLNEYVSLAGLTTDVEKYYKKASIFVLSSRTEGFPGALCEAMGYGCASIAFNCHTGPSDIINNKVNGVLVEPENEEQLSCEIQNLIDNREYRKILSSNSKKILDQLDITKITKKWLTIIKDVKK